MSRNGAGVYSLPPGSTVSNGDTSDATDINTPLADIETDQNTPRPVVAGGTGASSASAALVNLGLTATAAEINVMDGVTASTAELNILDGATLTVTELNYVDGVTSAIQTQLDAKQATGATLTSLEGLSLVAGDVLYATAADTLVRLPKGTAGQALVMNAGATAPEWAAVSLASYNSGNQTITSGGLLTLAHGLASAPTVLQYTLVCQTADAGYSIGDVIVASLNSSTSSTAKQNAVYLDATNVYVRFSNVSTCFETGNKGTGLTDSLTNSSWRLVVRAWVL